jgi:hypothetical protein
MVEYLQQYSKAIVALLAPALVAIGAQAGLNLSDETALTLATLVTGLLVYLVPNKTPKPKPVSAGDYTERARKAGE